MNHIFLGKPIHWLLIILLVLVGWITGVYKIHVVTFNLFVIGAIVVTTALIIIVLRTSPTNEQVTRDPISAEDDSQ